ncbi:LysR family transcriptional regulator [Lipingzhangella sp. LS1_29]|uniref:LysR family transcriptional regulator n=1 Tax=Lipingzhangella rawalii TaxID=2055835 RepID=A0ABU2H248_9ACTN|nr:LysR family transcriptional regulator [Lipingzhangella rawalii]MDS1269382.1 LysR family transcriptional regulator [Lipingzhangella rawalii]
MLSVDRLRVLHAVAVSGSLGGAARALHVTNSAVSQQLTKLEREVGQPLLERDGRGVRLTDPAKLLAERTGQILALVRAAEAEAEEHRGAAIGHLVLSAIATAARELVPAALVDLRATCPGLRVELRELEPNDSVPALTHGDVDLALLVDWEGAQVHLPEGIQRQPLLQDVADIALPVDHPLAQRDLVHLDELAHEPWISWTTGSICDEWLSRVLQQRSTEPLIAHAVEEHQTKLALISAGLGTAVIPRLGRGPVPEGVRMVAVQPALVRQVYVCWRTDSERRPAVRATVAALHTAAQRYQYSPDTVDQPTTDAAETDPTLTGRPAAPRGSPSD